MELPIAVFIIAFSLRFIIAFRSFQKCSFEVGDRVKITGVSVLGDVDVAYGKYGTIISIDNTRIGVELDEDVKTHSCGGKCKMGHGFWFYFAENSIWSVQNLTKVSLTQIEVFKRKYPVGSKIKITNDLEKMKKDSKNKMLSWTMAKDEIAGRELVVDCHYFYNNQLVISTKTNIPGDPSIETIRRWDILPEWIV